jgi:hypothetical protein
MSRFKTLLLPCVLALTLTPCLTFAQTTNQGTDFYLGFPQNYIGAPVLHLFLTGNTATTGTVQIPGLGFTATFSVSPGTITAVSLPSTAEASANNVILNNGIHVTSIAPITVYGLSQITATTDAYLGLPATLLGTSHIVLAYNGIAGFGSEFQVVATTDGTQVTITPSASAIGHALGVPYTITLNRLQTYQLQPTNPADDLTGTLITSTAPIALFSGSACTDIPNSSYSACDYVVEQIPATAAWGQNFLAVPLATRKNGDLFRVLARDAGTTVTIDGTLVATLGAAKFYQAELSSTSNHTIVTSGPALVAQYSNSTTYDNVLSDPMMMLISPTEQFQTSYAVTTAASSLETYINFINVVAPASSQSSCRIDGNSITNFTPIGTTAYVGAKIPVATGTHTMSCSDPFGVYVYGFASFDSYGYPGGLGLKGISAPRCDVNSDGRIDTKDINLIFAARNTPAAGIDDPRDADGDLQITVADARVCQQKCTSAGCAVN